MAPDWARVEFAPDRRADRRGSGLAACPDQKAPGLQATLRKIREERGDYSLEFLGDMSALKCPRSWLTEMNGIGKKTASVLLLFCFGSPAVADRPPRRPGHRRVGLLPPKASMEDAHDLVLGVFEPDQMFEAHVNLVRRGRKVFTPQRPAHKFCPLLVDRCRFVNAKAP